MKSLGRGWYRMSYTLLALLLNGPRSLRLLMHYCSLLAADELCVSCVQQGSRVTHGMLRPPRVVRNNGPIVCECSREDQHVEYAVRCKGQIELARE